MRTSFWYLQQVFFWSSEKVTRCVSGGGTRFEIREVSVSEVKVGTKHNRRPLLARPFRGSNLEEEEKERTVPFLSRRCGTETRPWRSEYTAVFSKYQMSQDLTGKKEVERCDLC